MRKKFGLALLVLMVLISLVPAWAQAQGTITGNVTGKAGDLKRLAGITLDGPNRYVSMTNSRGEFRVQNVLPGQYTVTVTQSSNVQRFIVHIDGNNKLDLQVGW